MQINGWTVDAEYLIGRRFEFVGVPIPDVTFVSATTKQGVELIRVHDTTGGAEWYPLASLVELIAGGVMVESETGVPFVNERLPGPGKGSRLGVENHGIPALGRVIDARQRFAVDFRSAL